MSGYDFVLGALCALGFCTLGIGLLALFLITSGEDDQS
jgi:hypothetical protein